MEHINYRHKQTRRNKNNDLDNQKTRNKLTIRVYKQQIDYPGMENNW